VPGQGVEGNKRHPGRSSCTVYTPRRASRRPKWLTFPTRSLLLGQTSLLALAAQTGGQTAGSRSRSSAVGTLFPSNRAQNRARTEVDLTRYPGQSASIPSMALRNGSTPMFHVRGYVTVTWQ